MRRLIWVSTAAVALLGAGIAVAHEGGTKSITKLGATTFAATTASDVSTSTCSDGKNTYATTRGRWTGAATGAELFANLKALPGFGDQKAKIFIALLGKRVGVTPPGWEQAAGFYGEHGCFSVADVDGPESLAKVREYKRAAKAEAKAKSKARP